MGDEIKVIWNALMMRNVESHGQFEHLCFRGNQERVDFELLLNFKAQNDKDYICFYCF